MKKAGLRVLSRLPFYSAIKAYKLIIYSQQQPKQRSAEWFENRYSCITASSCSICKHGTHFGESLDQYIQHKRDKYTRSISNKAIDHGVLYEDSAVRLFEKVNNVIVHEAALVNHPTYPFLGASVDGLYLKYDRTLQSIIGGCIEIKIPKWRKDIVTVPSHYIDQMQFQMEVLNLNVCDHLVCKIIPISNVNKMFANIQPHEMCGVIVKCESGRNYYFGEFFNFDIMIKEEFIAHLIEWKRSLNIRGYNELSYYKIIDYSMIQVFRDRSWFDDYLPYFISVYNRIVEGTDANQIISV